MVEAFPNLTEDERLTLAAKSIDIETSLRNWLGGMLGEEPDSPRVDDLIATGNEEGLRTMAAEEAALSEAETETLALCACGLNEVEVAKARHVAPETVKSQTKRIRQKLGARNTTHAVTLAIARGVFDEALAA